MMKRLDKQCLICEHDFLPKSLSSVYCLQKFSKNAYKLKMLSLKNEAELKALADKIPENRTFISSLKLACFLALPKELFYQLVG